MPGVRFGVRLKVTFRADVATWTAYMREHDDSTMGSSKVQPLSKDW